MKNAREFIALLRQQGVNLWLQDGQLLFRAPVGVLQPDVLDTLRSLKPDIIELLLQAHGTSASPIQSRSAGSLVPVSNIQQLILTQSRPENGGVSGKRSTVTAHNVEGELDLDALRASLAILVERHEALRTKFTEVEGIWSQVVQPFVTDYLVIYDLTGSSEASGETRTRCVAEDFVAEEVNRSIGPLFKVALLRVSALQHIIIFALDPVISDGASNDIIVSEFWTLYGQLKNGVAASLPTLSVQYPDYAIWEQGSHHDWLAQHQEYWYERLKTAPHVEIRSRESDTFEPHVSSTVYDRSLGQALTAELRAYARQERCLLAVLMLTVYIVVMFRKCEQYDLIIPFIDNGRYRPELESVVGALAQILYLRVEGVENETLQQLLHRVEHEFYAACAHRDFNRIPTLMPRLETDLHFNWQAIHTSGELYIQDPRYSTGLRLRPVRQLFPFAKKPPLGKFTPFFFDDASEIYISLLYRQDLFPLRAVKLFVEDLRRVAGEFVHNSSASVGSLTKLN